MEDKPRPIIYKKDLKFSENIDVENSDFESDDIRNMYNDYSKRPKIELRIKESEMENFEYLDLSELSLTDELLDKLVDLKKIEKILKKIIFLDISNNLLKNFPERLLNKYKNIEILDISRNRINSEIENDNLIELKCEYNKIRSIKSCSIKRLSSNDNELEKIDIPSIEILLINNNKLENINSYNNLEYLECINNKLKTIKNMYKLSELYISNNYIEEIDNLENLKILNCVDNPIKKIKYFENVITLVCSTSMLSSKYKIKSLNKINNKYYFINIDKN